MAPAEAEQFVSTDEVVGFTKEYPEDAIRAAIGVEVINQGNGRDGYWTSHTRELHDSRLFFEARRIVEQFESMTEPNGPNKSHYVFPLPDFYLGMSQKDRDSFFDFIPYRSISVGHIEGRDGLCLTVLGKEIQQEHDELAGVCTPKKRKSNKEMER